MTREFTGAKRARVPMSRRNGQRQQKLIGQMRPNGRFVREISGRFLPDSPRDLLRADAARAEAGEDFGDVLVFQFREHGIPAAMSGHFFGAERGLGPFGKAAEFVALALGDRLGKVGDESTARLSFLRSAFEQRKAL